MTWLTYITLNRTIRELLPAQMTRGASDELDRKLATLMAQRRRVDRAGWFS
jgi:hypothetical protein